MAQQYNTLEQVMKALDAGLLTTDQAQNIITAAARNGGSGGSPMSAQNNPFGPVQMGYGNTGMGWNSAMNVTPGSAYQSPQQIGSINAQAGVLGGMYASDNALAGQLGSANIAAGASNHASDNQLTGQLNSNQTNYGIADLNALADRYKSFMGYSAADVQSLRNLYGIKDTNQSNQNIAGIQGNTQLGVAGIQQYDDNLKAQALVNYLGGGGTGTGGTGGLGGGGLGSGGASSGGGTVTLGTGQGQGTGQYAPVVPAFQNFTDIMANKQKAATNSDIARQAATQARDYARNRTGAGGMSMRGGVGDQLGIYKMQALGDMTANNTKVDLATPQYNAQNAATYANMGLQQYNAEQDRANRLQLAKTLNPGTIISALA